MSEILTAIMIVASAFAIVHAILRLYLWASGKYAIWAVQRMVTKAFLESEGMKLAFWRQTPDNQLTEGQLKIKRAVNSRGYRAKLK